MRHAKIAAQALSGSESCPSTGHDGRTWGKTARADREGLRPRRLSRPTSRRETRRDREDCRAARARACGHTSYLWHRQIPNSTSTSRRKDLTARRGGRHRQERLPRPARHRRLVEAPRGARIVVYRFGPGASRRKKTRRAARHRWYGATDMRRSGHRARTEQYGLQPRRLRPSSTVIANPEQVESRSAGHAQLPRRAQRRSSAAYGRGAAFPSRCRALSCRENFRSRRRCSTATCSPWRTEELLRSYQADGAVAYGRLRQERRRAS